MDTLSLEESRLIEVFLITFQKMVSERVDVPFNPRSLTIISQPDLKNPFEFNYITYNKWFDEMAIQADIGSCNNIVQASLEVPIRILIQAEEAGKPLISKKDIKKLTKALKLISEIKLEKQR